MNNQEQAHLEKTLAILSDKLQQAQKHSKTLLQQDLGHVFQLHDDGGSRRRKRRRIPPPPPPGLLPLLTHKGISHTPRNPDTHVSNPTPESCTGVILQERLWLRLVVTHEESMEQAHLIWLAPPTPIQVDRSTVFTTSPHETVFYAATTMVDPLNTMDIELGVRYRTGEETWMDTVGLPITWHEDPVEWMKNDLDLIHHWAPILYPYKAHMVTHLSPHNDWITLNEHIHVSSDASVLFVQGSDHFAPIQAHVYALRNHALTTLSTATWDGVAMTTQERLQQCIVALIDQSQSPPQSRLANREHSLAQLAALLSPP
ncbi:hypothetical protein [Absidia glauca]|uniref:Uncharacterized protein n=1 Tax=Absidia glauca TaxID=4829 RepID=A0A163M3M3_ABSGL|nr:hypothetical protein [Absidia glauca]